MLRDVEISISCDVTDYSQLYFGLCANLLCPELVITFQELRKADMYLDYVSGSISVQRQHEGATALRFSF